MPLRKLHIADSFVYQSSGNGNVPIIYLPGVHGCWTPLEQARKLFGKEFQLIEVAYPLFDDWSLEHYADALLTLLNSLGLDSVHLVGESFGSLVGWKFGIMQPTRVRSHVLIGGFTKAPGMYMAATAGLGLSVVPAPAFDKIVDSYVSYKNAQGETRVVSNAKAYPAVRGVKGQNATANRMRLIQETDFLKNLPDIAFPVRYIGGAKDRVVPVTREVENLDKLLPASCVFESVLIPEASHMIIASHAKITVEQISKWVLEIEHALR